MFGPITMSTDQAEMLRALGIRSLHTLLLSADSAACRQRLAELTEIPEEKIREWSIIADLVRIPGVSEARAMLLIEAGVMSMHELGGEKASVLHHEIIRINEKEALFRRPPSPRLVARWIYKAKSMGENLSDR